MTPASVSDLPLHLRIGAKRGAQALNALRIARHQAAQETAPAKAAEATRTLPNGKTNFAKPAETPQKTAANTPGFAKSGELDEAAFSFGDLLDVVNPLQHLPLVSDLYREVTGDEISPPARVVGSTLYGGALGAAASLVNTVVEQATGDDIGGHVLAFLTGEEEAPAPVQTADARPAQPPAAEAPVPEKTPVRLAEAPALPAQAKPAAQPDNPGASLPALSPAAFDALLRSVNDPDSFAKANEEPVASAQPAEETAAASQVPAAPTPVTDPLTRLARSLDKYEAAYGGEALKGRLTNRTY